MPRQERLHSATGIYHVMLRGINCITYDYGHHPSYINMNMTSGPRNITNDYTPDGRKLLSKHVMSIPKVNGYTKKTITDKYVDGLMLRGDTTLLWRFDGGYVELNDNGTPTSWNYYVTDHLGSTRKVVDSNDNVKETINYYPFGSEMKMQDPAQMAGDTWQPYRFTGKELDQQNSLNWYDFGARWFDVAGVPMWTSVDPLAEKYYNVTPYSYCAGDPVNKIDPDGRDWLLVTGNAVCWYGGEAGDKKNLIDTYKATSGYKGPDANGIMWNLQKAKYQNIRNGGPTPEGKYHINLEPDPERIAKADLNTGDLLRDPNGGIEKIPDFVENPNKEGYGWSYTEWGQHRAHLTPDKVTGAKNSERDNYSYYLHDSQKGYTHGCTEVETKLFDKLNEYRNNGNTRIDVIINYGNNQNHSTNGGTKKNENN